MNDQKRGGDWKEWSQHVLIEIQRLNLKQEKMSDKQIEIFETLSENTKQLEIHIEGVKLAREQNAILRADVEKKFDKVDNEIQPLKEHVQYVNVAFKFWGKLFAVIIGLPACIYYVISIYLKLKGQ